MEIGDLDEVYDTERHLLYFACPPLVTSADPASECLDDLDGLTGVEGRPKDVGLHAQGSGDRRSLF